MAEKDCGEIRLAKKSKPTAGEKVKERQIESYGGIFMFEKKKKRFNLKEEENYSFGVVRIIVDTKTGVNYIMTVGVGSSSITPLLDSNGNVVIDK